MTKMQMFNGLRTTDMSSSVTSSVKAMVVIAGAFKISTEVMVVSYVNIHRGCYVNIHRAMRIYVGVQESYRWHYSASIRTCETDK